VTPASAPLLRFAPLDSERFGLRIYRGSPDAIDAAALAAEIARERVDVAILRIPARDIGGLRALEAHGLAPFVADTLVSYDGGLPASGAPVTTGVQVTLEAAHAADASLLADMGRASFAGYASHYHANPLFAADRILEGYAEWAARHATAADGGAAWLVRCGRDLVGFSCYRIDASTSTAAGVLNAILPEMRERGYYRAMLRAMLDAFAAMGLARFEIATQVHNVPVQRVWIASGLSLRSAWNTVHINAPRDRTLQATR
jgi:RimJ/RimL family protein N-acetyltransferase